LTIPNNVLEHTPLLQIDAVEAVVQTGDLFLCSGHAAMSKLIRFATRSTWSHVAIAVRVDSIERVLVCESVEKIGVRALPLRTFLLGVGGRKPYRGQVLLARHATLNAAGAEAKHRMIDGAFDQLGDPFAARDLIKIATRIIVGSANRRMPSVLKADNEYICSEYAALCFSKAGVKIPWDGRGFIAPCDFAQDPATTAIGRVDLGGAG
jgi:hypothetical protein